MSTRKIIEQIETKYDVSSLSMKDVQVWLHIKAHLMTKIIGGAYDTIDFSTKNLFSLFFSSFRGFSKWFKHYDYWFITGSNLRKHVNGKAYNILFDYPAEKLGCSLIIELPLYKHGKRKEVVSKNLASKGLLIMLETIYTRLFLRNVKIENQKVLDSIFSEYKTSVSALNLSKKMVAQYHVMKWILKYKKPKVAFLNTSYSNYGYIRAFKEKGIKVVEFQHGVITKEHHAYSAFTKFDPLYSPDYLLTFGKQEIEVFNKPNLWISIEKVVPIGNFFIEYVQKELVPNNKINELKKKYRFTFCASLQEYEAGWKLIPELINIATKNKDFLFIMKPRSLGEEYFRENYKLPENMIFLPNMNVYEAILNSDYHITVNSTCALEAPSMGVRNILYNIDNSAYSYYKDFLNETTTNYVNNEQEFMEVLNSASHVDKQTIKDANSEVIAVNYFETLNNLLPQITEIKGK